uniref:Secreted protein n=1 Tax=Nelumbo nucifera TaxID=4432 RepID=A0A822ZUI6_NELNU|nr:TPA_asm: hypothetical protein HUJ06_018839 [Nelumbo nucifera]
MSLLCSIFFLALALGFSGVISSLVLGGCVPERILASASCPLNLDVLRNLVQRFKRPPLLDASTQCRCIFQGIRSSGLIRLSSDF